MAPAFYEQCMFYAFITLTLPLHCYILVDHRPGLTAPFHADQVELRHTPGGGPLRPCRYGPVKVDPLAPLQAIEWYLVIRGYGRSLGCPAAASLLAAAAVGHV